MKLYVQHIGRKALCYTNATAAACSSPHAESVLREFVRRPAAIYVVYKTQRVARVDPCAYYTNLN